MNWTAKLMKHRNESRIAVYFDRNADLIERIKQIKGARWSQQNTVWHIPDTIKNRARFKLEPLANSLPSAEGIVQIEKFKQWLRSKRYIESTINIYSEALKSFLVFYRQKPVSAINNEDVIIFNNDLILKRKLSASYQNQTVNAIKLYFMTFRETKIEIDKNSMSKKSHAITQCIELRRNKINLGCSQ